jgi:hypothetical protein
LGCREVFVPEVGDQIEVVGAKVEQATRIGVVTDVVGRMITVEWATGNETVFVPAPGTLTVLGRADARRGRTKVSARASRDVRGAISARPSKTKKKAVRKAPVPRAAKRRVTKKAARKAPVPKTAKKRVTKKAATKAPVPKAAKRRVTKKAARKAPVSRRAQRRVTKKAARKRIR